MEAVPIAMSCFALLCEEADIRCGADEMTVTCLLPNYTVYLELASASTVMTTGTNFFNINNLLVVVYVCLLSVFKMLESKVCEH